MLPSNVAYESSFAATEKSTEFSREFQELPAILVQHPGRSCAYFIPADRLVDFLATPDVFAKLRPGTVAFTISGEEIIDEMPPFNQDPSDAPDIQICFAPDRTSYVVPFEALEQFKIEQPKFRFGTDYVSFIIPAGMELVEEIPLLKRGLLQSNTG
jgi:hypothetical protein